MFLTIMCKAFIDFFQSHFRREQNVPFPNPNYPPPTPRANFDNVINEFFWGIIHCHLLGFEKECMGF